MRRIHLLLALSLAFASCGEKSTTEAPLSPTAETPPDTSLAYDDDGSVRTALRAGKDYPGERIAIDERIQGLLDEVDVEPKKAFAIITPHASLVYSGRVAAAAFARVEMPDTVIVLSSKHHGIGQTPALWGDGPFIIPGHAVEIRVDLVDRLVELVGEEEANVDRAAFTETANHPLENQLPFITTLNPNTKIVPFTVFDHNLVHFPDWDLTRVDLWGQALADLVTELEANGEEVLVVTTTDLVHRVPLAEAEPKDAELMSLITGLELESFHDYVVSESITICGEIPVAITMSAARKLGHTNTEITGYDTSYTKLQNPDSVVGYGSAIFWPGSK